MAVTRLFAPVATPPPPKPPQVNIVSSSLLPDVETDVFGPGAGPALTAAGWSTTRDGDRHMWNCPPGDTLYRSTVERRNALVAAVGGMDEPEYKQWRLRVETRQRALMAAATGDRRALTAAVGVMSDLDMLQSTEPAGVTWNTLPDSIFPASADTRWTGGFAYAPENQYAAQLADPCGQLIDLPAVSPPTGVAGTPTTGTGTLSSGTYNYEVTALTSNGESLPSSASANVVLSATGENTVTWTAVNNATVTGYRVYRLVSTQYKLIGTVSGGSTTTYVDNANGTPGAVAPTLDSTAGPGSYTNLAQVLYIPFLIQVEDSCSTWGWEARDFTGRALRLLDAATPNAIEREFWSGAFAQNTLTGPFNGSNAFLTQSSNSANGGTGLAAQDLTPGTPPSITRGIQILEDYIANTGFGGQGMLHVAPESSPNLLGARRVGSLLLSVMDNIVVPGSGYPTSGNTGPAGNANVNPGTGYAWIFASDLLSVRLGKPNVWPSTMAEATDRGSFATAGTPNLVRIRAQRFAAATFDTTRLAACRVTLST